MESIEYEISGTKLEMERDGTIWLDSGERDSRIDIWQTDQKKGSVASE